MFVFNLFQWNQFAFISCEHISPFEFIPVAYLPNALVNQVLAIGVYNVMCIFLLEKLSIVDKNTRSITSVTQ